MSWTVTVNGNIYTETMMSGYGYLTAWPAMLQDAATDYSGKLSAMNGYMNTAMNAAVAAGTSQTAAAASASTALNAPGTSATSTSSMTIGAGSHAITTQAGKSIVPGVTINVARTSAPSATYQWGVVDSYDANSGVLTFTVPDAAATNGSGTYSDWTVSLSGARGPTGIVDASSIASATHAASGKSVPVDADELNLADSAASFSLKKITWANIKAALKTFFDGLYQPADAQLSSLVRQNSQSANYTTVLTDGGKHIFHPGADTTARTYTIDSNANVAYPLGTPITFVNQHGAGVITIAVTADTMRLAGAGTTGSRTLAADGIATAIKITSTEWIISGVGLT